MSGQNFCFKYFPPTNLRLRPTKAINLSKFQPSPMALKIGQNAQRLCRKGGGVETGGKCRGGRIRTYGLVVPNDARYRAALHPENQADGATRL